MIAMVCEKCGKKCRYYDSMAGRQTWCPTCYAPVCLDEARPASKSPPRPGRRSRLVGVAAVAFGALGLWFFWAKLHPEPVSPTITSPGGAMLAMLPAASPAMPHQQPTGTFNPTPGGRVFPQSIATASLQLRPPLNSRPQTAPSDSSDDENYNKPKPGSGNSGSYSESYAGGSYRKRT